MLIEPSAAAFAARYARGEPQVVWTTLVADLETPVSAFLKLAGGRGRRAFCSKSVEGGEVRGRYSIIGLEPDLILRVHGRRAEINRRPRAIPTALPRPETAAPRLARLIAESRIALPESLPPMAAGVFGYLGYDMVRLMEDLPAASPDPIGIPDAILIRPTLVVVFDAVEDTITVVTPVRPQAGVTAKAALARAVERLSGVVDALDQPLDKSAAEIARSPARVEGAAAALEHDAGRVQAHGRARQGLHHRRRYFSGRAVAALRDAVRAAAVRALPRATARQPFAVSVLSRFRRLRGRRIEPRDPGQARATVSSPSAPSPARAGAARPRTKTRRWRRNCSPIRRNAPST